MRGASTKRPAWSWPAGSTVRIEELARECAEKRDQYSTDADARGAAGQHPAGQAPRRATQRMDADGGAGTLGPSASRAIGRQAIIASLTK